MADFVAVLKKTLDGLGDTTPATREKVYEKARATIAAKLAAINPPPPAAIAERQKRALEDAIVAIEREYSPDPLSELEDVFASLKNAEPRQAQRAPAAPVASAAGPARQQAPLPPEYIEPGEIADEDDDAPYVADEQPKRRYGWLLVAAVVLAVVAGGGYGIWLNKDTFGGLFGLGGTQMAEEEPADAAPADAAATPPAEPEEQEVAAAPAAESTEGSKFTQRLNSDGSEIDAGPAGGGTSLGEGTSVAAVTQPPASGASPAMTQPQEGATPDAPATAQDGTAAPATTPAAPTTTTAPSDAPLAVGQKAIFYEERTGTSDGSAEPGNVVWTLVQEPPGSNLPPEPAIRAEATIPGKGIQLRMTIRRNADQTLPASHIIEMIFLTPENFAGGGVDNILRVAMKGSEQEAGNPLIGIPAKISDGFFLVALNDTKPEMDANLSLLRSQSWIDVPIVYTTGRRALFTMEKGIPGEKVFDEAIKAWDAKAAG